MRSVGLLAIASIAGLLLANGPTLVQGQAPQGASISAVAGQKGGWDVTGPYEVVRDWPKPLSTLPGHENWTWGSVQGVFAESPNRVFVVQRGELPRLTRPATSAGPRVRTKPVVSRWAARRSGTRRRGRSSSPPGAGGPGADPDDPAQAWRGRMGIDARWEHLLVVFNAAGDIVEQWTQWDALFKRPHSVYINPYDPEKHVWVVDDHSHAVFKFTNDGKRLVQTTRDAREGWRRRRALQPADVPHLAAGQHVVRRGRLQRDARGEVRQGREIPADVGTAGRSRQGEAARLLQHRARHRGRSSHAARLCERPVERAHPGVRRAAGSSSISGRRPIHRTPSSS